MFSTKVFQKVVIKEYLTIDCCETPPINISLYDKFKMVFNKRFPKGSHKGIILWINVENTHFPFMIIPMNLLNKTIYR